MLLIYCIVDQWWSNDEGDIVIPDTIVIDELYCDNVVMTIDDYWCWNDIVLNVDDISIVDD